MDHRFYQPANFTNWTGRIDGTEELDLRWHQVMEFLDLRSSSLPELGGAPVVIGFATDEGVRRNSGRTGAASGPSAIRQASANFPYVPGTRLLDAGDITCHDGNLEAAQQELAKAVQRILEAGGYPLLLGGGHEITYGNYTGIERYTRKAPAQKIGVINLDAHFDIRKPGENGVSSGTGFWQIAHDCASRDRSFNYLAIGIQPLANTQRLFKTMADLSVRENNFVDFLTIDDYGDGLSMMENRVRRFLEGMDHLYLTIDMDIFAAAFAPGVSATNYTGIYPDKGFFELLKLIVSSGKVISADIAELNPHYDIDQKTAKLAAAILYFLASASFSTR